MFRYYNLLAPVLGGGSVCADVDSTADDATLQLLNDKDCDMCRFLKKKLVLVFWTVALCFVQMLCKYER